MNLKILNSQIVDFLQHPDFNSNNFDVFTKYITQNENVILVNKYLNRNRNMFELGSQIDAADTRKFISIYLFLKFPKIHNIDSQQKIGKELLNYSKQLKFLFRSISIYLTKTNNEFENIIDDEKFHNSYIPVLKSFFKKFSLYLDTFDRWKKYDLEHFIFKMSLDYYKFEKKMKDSLTRDLLPELYSACLAQKNKILKYVKMLDSRQGILKFSEYLDIIKEYETIDDTIAQHILTQKISSTIHINVMVEEWDKLEIELEEETYEMLGKMLVKIKEAIRECVPKKKNLHIELEEIIDEAFIINQIQDKVFNIPDFKKLIDYLFTYLRKFQSPSEDENTNLLEEELNNLLDDYEYNLPFIIRFFLENIYIRFDNIRRYYFLFINQGKN